MANEMIKFYRGLVSNLPAVGTNGALYITTDEGGIYYGTGTGMKRLGDFIQVANVAALPTDGANTSALYYCVAENILAKWNGATWTQINKQPTADELKTLLGLGTLAYKSEVAESDLNSDLVTKINNASGAQHTHDNKGVIDGITSDKVTAWDNAEKNAKDYADGLNTAMNTRVEALEAIDHEHTNKALLDTYTQTEANLADAVDKKHSHTFNETELNKIVEGDVAKWNAAQANAEAKAAELDAALKLELQAEIDADVKVVADDLAGYKTSNNEALAGVKATAEAAAVATEVEAALALKADKSVVEAMYTNAKIDELIAEAKKYADDNDANTTYGIVYDSENKEIKLVEGGSELTIDASDFIKDGMISNVTIGDDNDLVITFNTDAGKENIVLPLDQLVDIYTGVEGARVKVTVASDKSISAELVAGSISKNYLDEGVQASLGKADTALQAHQDISHLATKTEVETVDKKFENYTTTTDLNAALALKADKTQVATDIATAKSEAISEAATDAAKKYEEIGVAKGLVDALEAGQVKTNKEAIEAINNESTGILKQAKDYVDGKDSAMNTRVEALENMFGDGEGTVESQIATAVAVETKAREEAIAAVQGEVDAVEGRMDTAEGKITALETESAKHALKTEVEAVDAKFADYTKTADLPTDLGDFTNNAGYAKTADVNTELDNKADKTQVATDIANAIAPLATTEALNGVDAKFANYKTAEAQKAIDDEQDRRLGVIEGDYLKAADIANFETKENVKKVADDLAAYVETNDAAVADRYTKSEADNKFAVKGEDSYDDTEVRGLISDNADAIAAETERATGIENGLRTDVNTILGDYLKASDKTELEGKITAEETRAKGVEESLQTQINTIMNNPDAEGAINSINEFTQYVKDHGAIAEGFRTDIDKNKEDIAVNAKAIADQATSDAATYETKTDATAKLTEAKGYTDTEIATEKADREAKEAELAAAIESAKAEASNQDVVVLAEAQKYADQAEADANSYTDGKISSLKTELQGEIDSDVKVVNDALEAYKTSNDAEVAKKANSADVYAKNETFTKDEVNAAIAAAVEAAHTWGEF